jgi:hypothetical protein
MSARPAPQGSGLRSLHSPQTNQNFATTYNKSTPTMSDLGMKCTLEEERVGEDPPPHNEIDMVAAAEAQKVGGNIHAKRRNVRDGKYRPGRAGTIRSGLRHPRHRPQTTAPQPAVGQGGARLCNYGGAGPAARDGERRVVGGSVLTCRPRRRTCPSAQDSRAKRCAQPPSQTEPELMLRWAETPVLRAARAHAHCTLAGPRSPTPGPDNARAHAEHGPPPTRQVVRLRARGGARPRPGGARGAIQAPCTQGLPAHAGPSLVLRQAAGAAKPCRQ